MKRAALAFCFAIVIVLTTNQLDAQMAPATPAPELKKLDFLAGDWTDEGTMTMGPPGTPSTKWTMTTHAEWMEGNFFLVEHDDADLGSMGKSTELAILGYDSDKKMYTYHAFSSTGEAGSSTGTVDGDSWTWLSTEHFGGKAMKGRYTMKVLSPTSYTMKYELSQDGANWTTAMEGKATKK